MPALPDESNALVLELFNADGGIRQSATGHDLVRRKGFGSEPIPAESMPEETFPPQETASHELDLLDFFPVIPPGKYELSASIRYAPGRLNAASDRRPSEILLDRCVSLDALSDKVCVPCLYSMSRHESNGHVRTLVQFDAGGSDVAGSLGRVQIGGIGPEPRLSTANFVSAESIDPDVTRWVAWTDGGKLFLQSVSPEAVGPVVKPELGFEVSAIAGRPVVQADGNVTLFLAGGDILHRGLFGPTAALMGMEEIVDAPSLPAPSELLTSERKGFRLAFGTAHSMPIRGIGSDVGRIIADSEDFLPLIEGETPLHHRVSSRSIYGAGSSAIVQSAPESPPCLLRMDWVQEPDAPRNVSPTGFPPSILEEDEHIVTASLATSPAVPPGSSQGLLHFVALGTSKGRLLAGNADEELLPIEDADPASARFRCWFPTGGKDLAFLSIHSPRYRAASSHALPIE
jgi:hypothetical protein